MLLKVQKLLKEKGARLTQWLALVSQQCGLDSILTIANAG